MMCVVCEREKEGGEKEHVTDHNLHQLDSNLEIHMQKKIISSQYSHGLSQEEDWAEGRGSFGFTSLSLISSPGPEILT